MSPSRVTFPAFVVSPEGGSEKASLLVAADGTLSRHTAMRLNGNAGDFQRPLADAGLMSDANETSESQVTTRTSGGRDGACLGALSLTGRRSAFSTS